MTTYEVNWSKTYYVSGSMDIEADSKKEAEKITLENIEDYEGSIKYDPEKNYVVAVKADRNNEIIVLFPDKNK